MQVTSEEGKGTSFKLVFPLSESVGKKEERIAVEPAKPDSKKIRVLLVDDNQMNVKLVKTIFMKKGDDVSTASKSQEALDAFIPNFNYIERSADLFDVAYGSQYVNHGWF